MRLIEEKRKGLIAEQPRYIERKKELIETEHPLMPLIREKSTGIEQMEKIKEIKSKAAEIAKKLNMPQSKIEEEISHKEILKDFDKLLNLIELEKKAKETIGSIKKTEELPLVHVGLKEKKEEIKTILEEIKKHEIITKIDFLLSMVKHDGIVSGMKAAKEIGIPYKQVVQFAEMLEQEGLIKVKYPLIGSIKLIDPEFEKQKNKKKK